MANGSPTLDARLYRGAMWLCPAGFRREYADQMVQDFADARHEATVAGTNAVWRLRLLIAFDFVRTCAVQWVRTGLPIIGLISLAVPIAFAEGLATLARRARLDGATDPTNKEMVVVLLLVCTTIFVIAATIVVTLWATRPFGRGRR